MLSDLRFPKKIVYNAKCLLAKNALEYDFNTPSEIFHVKNLKVSNDIFLSMRPDVYQNRYWHKNKCKICVIRNVDTIFTKGMSVIKFSSAIRIHPELTPICQTKKYSHAPQVFDISLSINSIKATTNSWQTRILYVCSQTEFFPRQTEFINELSHLCKEHGIEFTIRNK